MYMYIYMYTHIQLESVPPTQTAVGAMTPLNHCSHSSHSAPRAPLLGSSHLKPEWEHQFQAIHAPTQPQRSQSTSAVQLGIAPPTNPSGSINSTQSTLTCKQKRRIRLHVAPRKLNH